ncbi:uncharacterized protein DUF3237 [Williamsia muralis]|uniref:UPF0311 protein DFJ75_0194 n=1 Tax=Williamsia marianensis TaxID=85044 RepID=A0A495JWU9_WILMA|nr:DUF3237 domain-containing protein [Williamsia muralis]RKR93410.1 uncharacterized protein DUF3237 [Williamsia muralis]
MRLEPEFTYTAELAAPQVVGPGPYGLRQVLAVTGGTVSGERISGKAAPGGGDWLLAGEDGFGRLDVRAQFFTDDGAVIYMNYLGLVEVTEAAAGALSGGDTGTDFGDHYFVTTPRLECGDPKYTWVNQSIFVGQGRIQPGPVVEFQVFRVVG